MDGNGLLRLDIEKKEESKAKGGIKITRSEEELNRSQTIPGMGLHSEILGRPFYKAEKEDDKADLTLRKNKELEDIGEDLLGNIDEQEIELDFSRDKLDKLDHDLSIISERNSQAVMAGENRLLKLNAPLKTQKKAAVKADLELLTVGKRIVKKGRFDNDSIRAGLDFLKKVDKWAGRSDAPTKDENAFYGAFGSDATIDHLYVDGKPIREFVAEKYDYTGSDSKAQERGVLSAYAAMITLRQNHAITLVRPTYIDGHADVDIRNLTVDMSGFGNKRGKKAKAIGFALKGEDYRKYCETAYRSDMRARSVQAALAVENRNIPAIGELTALKEKLKTAGKGTHQNYDDFVWAFNKYFDAVMTLSQDPEDMEINLATLDTLDMLNKQAASAADDYLKGKKMNLPRHHAVNDIRSYLNAQAGTFVRYQRELLNDETGEKTVALSMLLTKQEDVKAKREETDRMLLNKPLLDTGLLSPARAKTLKSDASFVEIMKPGEFTYVVREGTEEISEAAAAKTVSNADGSFVIDGLAINRLAMNLRCSPGEGRSNKEIISILKRLDASQNMTDNKLTKEEADKQFSDAMYELKHIYYIHLKRLENTYGKKLSQMHPYDVLRMMGENYSKFDTDFSIMQDAIQMLECGRFFDMNKKEDKEFSRLAYYYNTVFSNNIKKFGMDFASNELSGEKMYVYSDKDRSDRGELNEKGMEDYHFMTDKDIGGASLTKKEQKEYINDLRKRAREEGWDDKLFGRYLDPKARIINKNIIDLNNHASVRVANDALNAQFEGENVSEADMKKMQEVVKASYEFKRSLASSVPKDTYKTFCNKGKNKKLKGINYKGILTLMRPIKLDKDGYPLNKDEETKIALNNNDLYFLTLDDMEQRKPFLDRIAGEARELCFTVDQLRDPAYILKNKARAIRHLAFMHNAKELYESNSSYYQKEADPVYRDLMSGLMTETNYVEYSSIRIQQALFGNGLEISYTGDDPVEAYTVKFEKGKGKSYREIKKENENLSKADRKAEEDLIRQLVEPLKKKGASKHS